MCFPCFLFLHQISCLGLEENVEGDPCKFILTSRSANGAVESFVLHSSHPGVREVWTLQISQILESQRNFLNGRLLHTHRHTHRGLIGDVKELLCTWPPLSLAPYHSSDLTNRVSEEPCRGKQCAQHRSSRWGQQRF